MSDVENPQHVNDKLLRFAKTADARAFAAAGGESGAAGARVPQRAVTSLELHELACDLRAAAARADRLAAEAALEKGVD